MDKYEEAKKHFELIIDNEAYTDKFQDHCKIAVELIDKATPRKVIKLKLEPSTNEEYETWPDYEYRCPRCDCEVYEEYCGNCGQRVINWSEDTKIL